MKKEIIDQKIEDLYIMLLGLNAYGSLNLQDLRIIVAYLESSFDIKLNEFDEDIL